MPKRVIMWWWELPRWVKLLKFTIIVCAVLSVPAMDAYRQWQEYRKIYDTYYAHFYASYEKVRTVADARYYADYYADFYASYYTSPAFRKSLRYALPSATEETISYPQDSPVASLTINDAGLSLIKEFEGLRLEPYQDVGGKLTIGYGHLIKPGEFYSRLTEAQATALLRADVQVAEAYVKRLVEVPLSYEEFSALTSLVYNIGPGHFRRSTLLRALNDGNKSRAAEEFLRWDRVGTQKVRGLSRRRKAEKQLFES